MPSDNILRYYKAKQSDQIVKVTEHNINVNFIQMYEEKCL